MPFSRAITYKLIAAGLISSVVVIWPGSRRGRRLIDGDSLDSYLESLTTKQALAELNAMRPHEMEGARRGFKGVWLCAAIYESQEFSPVEKLLLAEIDALTTDANACYASNAHFSNRLGITVTRVDHLLGKLTRLGYILRVSFDGRVTRRVLAPEYSSNPGHSIAPEGKLTS